MQPRKPGHPVLGEHPPPNPLPILTPMGLQALIEQYVDFVISYGRGFGKSYRTETGSGANSARCPTFHLAVAGMIAVVLGVSAGILSAVKPNSLFDNIGRIFASRVPCRFSGRATSSSSFFLNL
jgi:ABC-type dipeptide/oligopeptide/nickel transport system permease component